MRVRPATISDATHLAALVDIAGEGFASYFWSQMTAPGQSPIEIGRARAMRDEGSFTWRNAHVAEIDHEIAGALVGYQITDPVPTDDIEQVPEIARPMVLLEAEAPGHWYINVLAVFPEFRGKGVGGALLGKADELGREAQAKGMALIVASENDGAVRLYARAGFVPSHRRPITGFPSYKRGGDWVLMTKPCA